MRTSLPALLLLTPLAASQSLPVEIEPIAPTPDHAQRYGRVVELEGDLALVGQVYGASAGNLTGAVDVHRRTAGGWVLEQRLVASDASAHDHFGSALDLEGDVLVVGAPYEDDRFGQVYVFRQGPAGFVEEAILWAPDGHDYSIFGDAVAVSGDLIVVGSQWYDDPVTWAGRAYVYRREAGVWTHAATLTSPDPREWDRFGCAVAIQGDVVLVGCRSDDDPIGGAGSVHVYDASSPAFTYRGKLHAAVPTANSAFGSSLAVSGDLLLVGSDGHDGGASNAGAMHVLRRVPSGWIEEAELHPTEPSPDLRFGARLDADGDRVVTAAFRDDQVGNNSGAAWIFERGPSGWSQSSKLLTLDARHALQFGWDVGLAGDLMVVGADQSDAVAPWGGLVYAFDLRPRVGTSDCACSAGPCGNDDPTAGCANSTGRGARLLGGGSASAAADDLVLRVEFLPPNSFAALLFSPGSSNLPFGDGILCLDTDPLRLGPQSTGDAGLLQVEHVLSTLLVPPGADLGLQFWYRDTMGPCSSGTNMTEALRVQVVQ